MHSNIICVTMTSVDLYGGAIKTVIPNGFLDVATIKPVPDHQEVFVSKTNDESIIFDILEKVDFSDEEAANVHLQEIADINHWNVNIETIEAIQVPNIPYVN